ncbi:MAG: ATP-dependent RecD-like DNA helicase [Bradymonadales bacterium]|jgi:exodeoxyribonuclease V alpha subunit
MISKPKIGEEVQKQGSITRVRYTAPSGDFAIITLQTRRGVDFVCVGALAAFRVDDDIKVSGVWEESKYGTQIRVKHVEAVLPSTTEGIERFLSSQIKGVGKRLAARIVKHFGEQTLEVLDKTPRRLREVSGFSEKKVESVIEQWAETQESRQTFVFLQGLGLSYNMASKLFAQYGAKVVPTVQHQPYLLAKEVDGIGFSRADEIAQRIGFALDSAQRIEAGIDYALYLAEQNEGHCYLPYTHLVSAASELLQVAREHIEKRLKSMCERQVIYSEIDDNGEMLFYRSYMWLLESAVAEHICRMLATDYDTSPEDAKLSKIKAIESALGIDLAPKQREAVQLGLQNKVMVITGGPGTGKTTLVKVFVKAALQSERKIFLAAPTGRAAKRLAETTAMEAKTIHRLLEFSYNEGPRGAFTRNAENPLEVGSYIIDEASMLDLALVHALLCAMPDEAQILFVGDVDQLPSVGAGSVLKDLIDSRHVPVVRLNEVFRQAEQSLIVKNAHRINNGQYPVLPEVNPDSNALSEFYLINTHSPERAELVVKQLVAERLPARFGINALHDCQILSPMRKNLGGVEHLNQVLQDLLNPKGKAIEHSFMRFRVGDRVMQLKNDYERDVYNGDVGIILSHDSVNKCIAIQFDDKIVDYPTNMLDQLSLAYACTVHKSQGSEYPAVICVFLRGHSFMLQRNLVYTALTRARRIAIFITDSHTLMRAIHNNTPATRFTRLALRIAEKHPKKKR